MLDALKEDLQLEQSAPPVPGCLIAGCTEPAVDLAYCAVRRTMADDDTLWLHCAIQPAGWSDRLGRETLEPVPDQPGRWREREASASLCIWCPAPLAEGDRLGCEQHRTPRLVTDNAVAEPLIRDTRPVIGRHDLLALAERRGWEALPYKPGHTAGGTEEMWRIFAESARGQTLTLALMAVWERWADTIDELAAEGTAGAVQGAA